MVAHLYLEIEIFALESAARVKISKTIDFCRQYILFYEG